jgi:FHS family Na+ dependent glucose MFS transporter 1
MQTETIPNTTLSHDVVPVHTQLLPNNRFKLWKTILYCYTFIMVGAALMAMSPTLLRLSQKVGVSVESMSIVFTVRGVGYVTTVLLVGLIFDKYSLYAPEPLQPKNTLVQFIVTRLEKLIMIVSILFLSVSMFITPFVTHLWMLIVVNLIMGIGAGAIDVICNLMVVTLWEEDSNPYLQALHFCYGLGSFLCPLFMGIIDTVFDKKGLHPKWDFVNPVSIFFVTLAVVDITVIVFFIVLLFESPRKYVKVTESEEQTSDDTQSQIQHEEEQDPVSSQTKASLHIRVAQKLRNANLKIVLTTILTSICVCMYAGTENGYGGLIYSYVLLYSPGSFTESTASLLTTGFWLSFTATRGVAVFVSKFLSVRTMLVSNIIFTMISVIVLLSTTNYIAIWVATIVMGMAMASQYSNTIALPISHLKMKMSGVMASIIVTSGSLGEMVMPVIITALLKRLMLISFIALGSASVLYIVLLFFIPADKVVSDDQTTLQQDTEMKSISTKENENEDDGPTDEDAVNV